MQSPNTEKLLGAQDTRPVSEDLKYAKEKRHTPVSEKAQCTKADGSVDLNVRDISVEDHDAHQKLRYLRGRWFEEARTAYLKKVAAEGKIHHSLMNQIETDHVMPPDAVKEKAEKAYMGLLASITDKFKDIMKAIFKPTHNYADLVSEAMKRVKDEK